MVHRLPDFLIIGAQKCGTSWLHNEIRQHPDIFMPEQKELHYFSSDRQIKFTDPRSLDWYASWFQEAPAGALAGEATPSYIYRPEAAANIFATIPQVKLIATLRQPAERAYSQWRMQRRLNYVPMDLSFPDAFFSTNPEQIQIRHRGLYGVQLQRLFEIFRREQIQVLFYDDLKSNYRSFLESTYAFLGVDSSFVSYTAEEVLPPTVPGNDSAPVTIPDEYRRLITRYYCESIERVEMLLDVDLAHWKDC